MIIVSVSPSLIEQAFRTGNITRTFEVVDGLPIGAEYMHARWNENRRCIEVHFTDPLPGSDRELIIKLRTHYREPSPLHPLVQLDEQLRRDEERDTR